MLAAPKYTGLDIPTFEGEEVFLMHEFKEGKRTIAPGKTSFLRACAVVAGGYDSLAKVLAVTSTELTRLSEHTGVNLIDYQWGFYKSSDTPVRPRMSDYGLFPADRFLVAKVYTVIDEGPNDLVASTRMNEVRKYSVR